jgi:hypothetical protein
VVLLLSVPVLPNLLDAFLKFLEVREDFNLPHVNLPIGYRELPAFVLFCTNLTPLMFDTIATARNMFL